MSTTRAIVFDIDDTLYPEREYTFSGYKVVAETYEKQLNPPFDLYDRMRELFDSESRSQVFDVIAAELHVSHAESLVPEMVRVFRNHQPTISLTEQTKQLLVQLRKDYKLGAISDGFLTGQLAKVQALGLEQFVDALILTDQWGRDFWKPHPRAFQEMSMLLKTPHTHCVYVGDNRSKDFIAPNALGWETVYLDKQGGVHADKRAPADGIPGYTITDLDELPSLLTGI